MKPSDYPEQEPFTEIGAKYHDRVLELAGDAEGIDVFLGDNPYQSLAVFPAEPRNAPVLCFIHGGGWTNGYKEWVAFMAPALNAHGISFVSLGYRLAPDHVFPSGLHDCADGVAWVYKNIQNHGGDPDRIFVGGHSAGGHYASLLALMNDWQASRDLPDNVIKGALPISGTYWFGKDSGLSMRPRFLGENNPCTDHTASPIVHISENAPAFHISYGEKDFPHLIKQAETFARALKETSVSVEVLQLEGCGHLEASYAAGDKDGSWVKSASQFIQTNGLEQENNTMEQTQQEGT